MLLEGPSTLPNFEPLTLYSFYPHPISPRSHVHSTLFPSSSSSGNAVAGPSSSKPNQKSKQKQKQKQTTGLGQGNVVRAEAGTSRLEIEASMKRAERRALMGRRAAGVGLGKDDDEVIHDEDVLDHEQHDINMFGHRFLLPYGRRLTQMEMDAAPSPSPSEHDHERRQEDHTMGSPMMETQTQAQGGNMDMDDDGTEEGNEVVDLDASIEDLDDSGAVEEGSMEEE
ncbi:uncharacterized protein I303_106506 [Kwoniella dejecticola CBS 10117]|uniref:Uncharacterized protein n=1 Tax=Kwoniella dejecticola CBS 10117 TaxID=1296121 RepID=A0A1A5ZUI6_9TREE|nr:uncharacterized protein I303_08236 [Kwoniella dejecticola CBS 10117]OBR81466.1 hypothetical protein I303_08236 [Kwoniella dejecticola CBS 10117]